MYESLVIGQDLKDRVEEIQSSGEEAVVALRALHALYFERKPVATTDEKRYLLAVGFRFLLEHGIPFEVDKAIFAEESEKFYGPAEGSKEL